MSSSLASVPLLDHSDIDDARLELERLARASAALKAGKLPTSAQLTGAIQKLLKSNVLQPELGSRFAGKVGGGKLSGPGKEVVQRARDVLEATVRLVMEKNPDDKIQRFYWLASHASLEVQGNLERPDLPVPTSEEIHAAGEKLQELLSVLMTSTQLRQLIIDSVHLFRDLFADAAEQVASASIETTKASKKAARAARPTDAEREQGKTGLEGKDLDAHDLKKQAIRSAEDAKDNAAKQAKLQLKKVREYVDESLPTDVKDEAIERFKAIIDEIQSNPQYEDAITTIVDLVRKYANLTTQAVKEAADKSSAQAETNQEADTAAALFRQIVESFTGPLDDVFRQLDKVIKDLEGDDRIKKVLDEAASLVDRAIYDPGYATSARAQRRAEDIFDRAQGIIKSNATWKADADALAKEVSKALDKAAHDRALSNLGRSVDSFNAAMAKFGRQGMSVIDGRAVWSDLTQVFFPRILGSLNAVPMPRVEYTSADVDLIIDNIRFTSASFVPDSANFVNHNELAVKRGYAAYASHFNTATTLSFSGLRLQARDISYYIYKKTGWVSLEDSGLLDVYIGSRSPDAEDGLSVTITVENAAPEDQETFFVLKKVKVSIEGFTIWIHESSHPITNWFASGAVKRHLQSQLVASLEEQIGELFKAADREFWAFKQRAIGAGRAAPDPLTFLRAVFMPTGSSTLSEVRSTGITKIGVDGEYILAIGIDEELLPGKRTGLGKKGQDIVSRKRNVERIMEEGRASLEEAADQAADTAREIGSQVREFGRELEDQGEGVRREYTEQEWREQRTSGWQSDAFDF